MHRNHHSLSIGNLVFNCGCKSHVQPQIGKVGGYKNAKFAAFGVFLCNFGVFGRAFLKGSKHALTATESIPELFGQPLQSTLNRQPLNITWLSFLLIGLSPEHSWQLWRVGDCNSK